MVKTGDSHELFERVYPTILCTYPNITYYLLPLLKIEHLHASFSQLYRTDMQQGLFYLSCSEFLAIGAHNPVNVDARVAELVRRRVDNSPTRYCFEEAQVLQWYQDAVLTCIVLRLSFDLLDCAACHCGFHCERRVINLSLWTVSGGSGGIFWTFIQ